MTKNNSANLLFLGFRIFTSQMKRMKRKKGILLYFATLLFTSLACLVILKKSSLLESSQNSKSLICKLLKNCETSISYDTSAETTYFTHNQLLKFFNFYDDINLENNNNINPIFFMDRSVQNVPFGKQKTSGKIKTMKNSKQNDSIDKALYFVLKYYYWCVNKGILYPNIPINLQEWLSIKLNFMRQNRTYIKEESSQCAFEMSKQELLKNFRNEERKDFREIKESIDCKSRQAAHYLLQSGHFNPSKIVFLLQDIDESEETSSLFLSTRLTITNKSVNQKLAILLKERQNISTYSQSNITPNIDQVYYPLNKVLNEINYAISNDNEASIPNIDQRIDLQLNQNDGAALQNADFEWNLTKYLKTFLFSKNIFLKTIKNRSQRYQKITKSFLNKTEKNLFNLLIQLNELGNRKYFHEVSINSKIGHVWRAGTHYDWRFFQNIKSLWERYQTLNELYDAWSIFAKEEHVVNWLSHGNLLSWAWSGGQFLWDQDIDLQLPMSHFFFLATNYNNTVFVYKRRHSNAKLFYLDINPAFMDNHHGNYGLNVIDGRFIDMESGLYIDLTSLSFKNLDDEIKHKSNSISVFRNKWIDFFIGKIKRKKRDKKTTVIGDKNFHLYQSIDSFSSLRKVPYGFLKSEAMIPHSILDILTEEYPYGLKSKHYLDYYYDLKFHGWIKNYKKISKSSESDNYEGLSKNNFEKIKNQWKDHYISELSYCKKFKTLDSRYCKWFMTTNSGFFLHQA